MNRNNFSYPSGVHTVLVTPFKEGTKEVDYEDLERWMAFQMASNVVGLVLLGSTSESATIRRDEKLEIVKRVHAWNKSYSHPKFITVGVGGNDTEENLEFARECVEYCDAFMVTSPHYSKPPQRGIFEHFHTISSHVEIRNTPIIMYNIPGRTCMNMLPETMKQVFDACPNVVAVKEASGSMEQIQKVRDLVPDLKVFSGDDSMLIEVSKVGGCGVISVASNVVPDIMTSMTAYCLESNFDAAMEVYNKSKMTEFIAALFCETNPMPIKFMLNHTQVFKSHEMRLPLVKLCESKHNDVLQALYMTGQYAVEEKDKAMCPV